MSSVAADYLDGIKLGAGDGASLARLGAYRGRQELFARQTPEVLAALREAAAVESSESSNRIEGVTAPHFRIEALVLKNSLPRDRSEQEIAGYRDALALIFESAEQMAFSVNVILQLHSMLYRRSTGRGGQWKLTPNEIIERDGAGNRRVRFKPPPPAATPALMQSLVEDYDRAVDVGREPLIIIPLAVLDLLAIHPFSDGNGRTARLLTLLLLTRAGFDVGRYISLERVIEESKETYYEALERSSQGWHDGSHDPLPWLSYFWGMLITAYGEFEERVGTVRTGKGAKARAVEAAIRRRTGAFGIADIENEAPGITRDWVRKVLRKMRDAGEVEQVGRGPAARWIRRAE